jgi:hypothetical protein
MDGEVTKGCPQGSCCGLGLWNIYYNSLLNINYTKQMKAIPFADDLILVTRGKTVREAENIADVKLSKVSAWAKQNKIRFNDQKSKIMLMSRRK